MTSRQCLFHQTVGCKKKAFDAKCLRKCKKSASIINLKEASFVLDKQQGDHNSLYSEHNFLNIEIPSDLEGTFSSFFVDLRDIKTQTSVKEDKGSLIQMFQNLIEGGEGARQALEQAIYPTTNAQYKKGL